MFFQSFQSLRKNNEVSQIGGRGVLFIYLHYEQVGMDFPLFHSSFYPSLNSQEVVVFLATISAWPKLQGFSPYSKGQIMLNFSETCFLKRFMPTAKVSLLVFACKSKTLEYHGCNYLNCKHQPNVCKFLLDLEA